MLDTRMQKPRPLLRPSCWIRQPSFGYPLSANGQRSTAKLGLLALSSGRQRCHERGELRGEDGGDGLRGFVPLGAMPHLRGEYADAALTGDDWRDDGAGQGVVGGNGA